MEALIATDVGGRLLDALRRRDYDALGGCFAPDATLRSVVPPGSREDDGPDAIMARFRRWTEEIGEYEMLEAEVTPFADMIRLRWAIRGLDLGVPDPSPSTFEQTAYAEVADGVITKMRLACSGERPLA
jgi:SnoaL-like protein